MRLVAVAVEAVAVVMEAVVAVGDVPEVVVAVVMAMPVEAVAMVAVMAMPVERAMAMMAVAVMLGQGGHDRDGQGDGTGGDELEDRHVSSPGFGWLVDLAGRRCWLVRGAFDENNYTLFTSTTQ